MRGFTHTVTTVYEMKSGTDVHQGFSSLNRGEINFAFVSNSKLELYRDLKATECLSLSESKHQRKK